MNPKHFWLFGALALSLNAAGWWWSRPSASKSVEAVSTNPVPAKNKTITVTSAKSVPIVPLTDSAAATGPASPVSPPKPPLLWQGARAYPTLDREMTVTLEFNQSLDATAPLPRFEVVPAVPGLAVSRDYNSLQLRGPFLPRQSYEVTLKNDLPSSAGMVLPAGEKWGFTLPGRGIGLSFPFDRGVLNPQGNLGLVLRSSNLSKVELRGHRLYPNNLAEFLRSNGSPEELMEPLVTKEFKLGGTVDEVRETEIGLREFLPVPLGGVYLIEARGTSEWRSDRALVTISNLAVTAQSSGGDLAVWVTTLSDGAVAPGAEVSVMSRKSQRLALKTADSQGLVRFKAGELDRDGGPWFLTAQVKEDWNYLELDRHAWQFDELGQEGRERSGPLDAFLFTDRGVYRPGETLHFSGLVRTALGGTPPNLPLELTFRRPDNRVWEKRIITAKSGQEGFFSDELRTDPDSPTGIYTVSVGLPGSDKVLAINEIPITPFEPARIQVKAKASVEAEAAPVVSVQADYLFGSPAAGCAVAWSGRILPKNFSAASYPGFVFGRTDEAAGRRFERAASKLDDKGAGLFRLGELRSGVAPGAYEVQGAATVTETGGRTVAAHLTVPWPAFAALPGAKLSGEAPKAGGSFGIEIVQATPAGSPAASGDVTWRLFRLHQNWTLQKSGDGHVWRMTNEKLPVAEGMLAAGPEVRRLVLAAGSSGPHVLELAAADGAVTDFALNVADERGGEVAEAAPHRLGLTLLSGPVRPGAKARVRVESAFPGRAWLTLQGGAVSWEKIVSVPKEGIEVEVPVSPDQRGNAWLTATVVRAVDASSGSWRAVRANGLLELPLDHASEKAAVSVEAAGEIRPGAKLDLTVRGPALAWAQVWAVDEGVLLATAYPTPDAWGHFYGRCRFDGDARDTYAALLPDHRRVMERIGAGDEGRMRGGPVRLQRKATLVRWAAPVALNAEGRASLSWEVPADYTGRLRLMAVLASGPNLGSAQADVIVASPVMVEATWPRFAAPGDEVTVPVKVFNRSKSPLDLAGWQLNVEGPVKVVEAPAGGTLDPGATAQRWLKLKMADGLGDARIQLIIKAGDETSLALGLLSVRPPMPRETRVTLSKLQAGETYTVVSPEDLFAGTVETSLALGTSPDVDLRPAVQRLLDYPHGCLEQTTSRLLVLQEAKSVLGAEMESVAKPMISAGLSRLALFQTSSGGLAYWPGDHQANSWATCYAAEALKRAQDEGMAVAPQLMEALPGYLRRLLAERDTPPSLQAHAAWLLAWMDQPETARMNLLTSNLGELDMAGRGHLALAWLAAGRRDRAAEVLTPETLTLEDSFSGENRLHSSLRGRAVLMRALLELNPNHPALAALAKAIDGQRDSGYWGTTLDNAAAVGALAAWRRSQVWEKGSLQVRCETPGVRLLSKEGDFRLRGRGAFTALTSGTGPVFATLITQGLRTTMPKVFKDNGLSVRRNWTDASGNSLWGQGQTEVRLRPGDLVKVEIQVRTGERVPNLAVSDLLPAGLEVESPLLKTSQQSVNNDSESNRRPDRVEFRDDRVLCFDTGTNAVRSYTYHLRATLPGRYVIPPLQGEAMYQPEINSGHAGGVLVVAE